MGSMRERRPGIWELRVYVGRDATGRKRWRSRTFHGTERAARKALDRLSVEAADEGRPAARLTVADLLARYVESRGRRWSPTTARNHRALIDDRLVPGLGARKAGTLRPLEVEEWVEELGASRPATARKCLAILRAAYENGIRLELVDRNPARSARPLLAAQGRRDGVELADVARAIHSAERSGEVALAALVRVAVVTGARRGELVVLRWSDVDLGAGVVRFERAGVIDGGELVEKGTKTGQVKAVALDPGTVAMLRRYRAACRRQAVELGRPGPADGYVWSRLGLGVEPWWPDTVTHRWRGLADSVGLAGVTFHDLRHAMVSTLVAAGFDPRVVADRAGHSTPAVTLGTYAHAAPARDQAAAELLGRLLG